MSVEILNEIIRCDRCGVAYVRGNAERHMMTCTAINPDEPDDLTSLAVQIGRVLFGGIQAEGASWEMCLRVARAVTPLAPQYTDVDRAASAKAAFLMCDQFNKENPRGCAGVIIFEGQRLQTTLEGPAMVFPDPKKSEMVMAWFAKFGWRPIHHFTKETKAPTVDEDLVAIGLQMKTQNKPFLAQALFQAAVDHNEENAMAWNELAVYLAAKGFFADAIRHYDYALEHSPDNGGVRHNRSVSLRAVGRLEEALADSERAVTLLPGAEGIPLTTAQIWDDLCNVPEALAILNKRIDKSPNDYVAHYNKSLVLLSHCFFEEGWREFKWRLSQPAISSHYEHYSIPAWNGEDLAGKRVLVWAEQGIGDEIMAASMLPDLIAIAEHVTVLCAERLVPLFKRSFPTATVDRSPDAHIVDTFKRQPLHPALLPQAVRSGTFDLQMSQGDLGLAFRKEYKSFKPQRYLYADVEKGMAMMAQLHRRFPGETLVGIAWHSKYNGTIGMLKGVDLGFMGAILKTPGVRFISLQYGDCADDIAQAELFHGVKIETIPEVDQMKDLDAFAALISSLDLVITVSNTTAHIAGALGTNCWMMTPEGPGRLWYWLRNIDHSIWYPNLTLYRQPEASHWSDVIARVASDLADWVQKQ